MDNGVVSATTPGWFSMRQAVCQPSLDGFSMLSLLLQRQAVDPKPCLIQVVE
jgi:hypothetical protein